MNMNAPRLLILDCDGVLIDSEIVVCRLVSEAMTGLGHPLRVGGVPQHGRLEGG